jgi:hypothetical protein
MRVFQERGAVFPVICEGQGRGGLLTALLVEENPFG